MPHAYISDAAQLTGTWQIRDGYLVAQACAVRTGVQDYAGSEVGRPELPVVRVYRSIDEVTAEASMRTWPHAPITLGHPTEDVKPDNYMRYARGEVSTRAEWKDGKIELPLIVKDAQAIKAIQDGSARELSAGYTCQLEFVDGIAPDGTPYDAIQKDIRINHLALVPQGRAGRECRIGDAAGWGPIPAKEQSQETPKMPDVPVVLGDKAVNVPSEAAPAIQAYVASVAATMAAADKAHSEALAARDAQISTITAERDALKAAQLTDAALDARVQERAALVAVARAILPTVDATKANDEIRKAVVIAKFGDVAKDKDAAYYAAGFDLIAKDVKPADTFADALRQQQPMPGYSFAQPTKVVDLNAMAIAAQQSGMDRRAAMRDAWNPNKPGTIPAQA